MTRPVTYVLRLGIGALAVLLQACATATGPSYSKVPVDPAKATIYIYRLDLGWWQSAYTPTILIDGKRFVELPKNGYSYTVVEPGTHTLGMRHNFLSGFPNVDGPIEVAAATEYFISVRDPVDVSNQAGGLYSTFTSILHDEGPVTGRREVERLKFVAPRAAEARR
jgi:hypothetical protein